MPVWKPRSDWLHHAVASALAEDECLVELILVDDGNDAPVAEMVADIDDPRLRVIRVDHGGPYAARNAGLEVARGAFIRFVDADDGVEPGSTGKLLDLALAEGGSMVVYGATMMCDADLRPVTVVTEAAEGRQAEACLLGGFNVYVVSILYPRAVIEQSGAWEVDAFLVSGDWDFVLRTLEHAQVRGIPDVVSYYRRNRDSVSRSCAIAEGVRAAQSVVRRYFERHPEQRGTRLERLAYLNIHLHGARSHFGRGETSAAWAQMALAARRAPLATCLAGLGMSAARLGIR